ncbi:MAG: FAD-binding and (Fe-S)-binding domain-containing protein [Roseovarius sp.]|nr:FAD-binding and (Fe-S)-binding domain-containing protein [Roseovarius sp.]
MVTTDTKMTMISRLPPPAPVDAGHGAFLDALAQAGFAGEIARDHANRTVLATDNSIYSRAPQAVLYPRDTADLDRIAHLAGTERFAGIVLAPRGGGTGTNGQSLTEGLVVDVSRHMNRILEIDEGNRRVRVQPGVVKDQLNAALRPFGLFFAPELSTSNRATLGGMISTDASGQGSCEYGKTRDHVLALEMVLLGGDRLVTRPLDEAELDAECRRGDRVGEVYRAVCDICDGQRDLIAERFPDLNRCLTGYDLAHLRRPDGRFDLGSVICGSEGTLGFLSEATLNVLPLPAHTALVNVRYGSFMAALRDAGALMGLDDGPDPALPRPTSIETVDDTVLSLAMEDFTWDGVASYFPQGEGGRPIRGINLVEFNADDRGSLDAKIRRFTEHLAAERLANGGTDRLGHTLAIGGPQVARLYAMRKRAVGLLGNAKGEKRPIPFVEDAAVPPERLADFIADFRAVLDARGLDYGMFGHVDAGVLHVRPAIDMKDPAQARLVREITDEVAALAQGYGGLLWGEHGKGVRSEYAPQFFGPLYPALRRIKGAFDPRNQLNPGKIATPAGPEKAPLAGPDDPDLLRIDGVTTAGALHRQIDPRVWQAYAGAVHCNGNAACFNYDPRDAMCPSWKATRERIHSPKGRASLMREWLRLQGKAGTDVLSVAGRIRNGGTRSFLSGLPRRLANNRHRRQGVPDFSHEVREAMAGCLACKSCAGQCPVKVDVPEFRARFLELYHDRYQRPLRDYLVAGLEFAVPLLSRGAAIYNGVLRLPGAERLSEHLLGLCDLPRLSPRRLRTRLTRLGAEPATPARLARLSPAEKARSVILVQDAFTTFFDAQVVADAVELLTRLGIRVLVAPFAANGKPMQVHGFLGAFERVARRQALRLRALADHGIPLIGIDPAMTLTYRQDYCRALGPEAVPGVQLLQEWMAANTGELKHPPSPGRGRSYRLLSHCTEATTRSRATREWQAVFAAFGCELELVPTGCCGMSGTYGHEARNRVTSRRIYDLSWREVTEAVDAPPALATGYSCRSQVQRFSGLDIAHPVQALLATLRDAGTADRTGV